MGIYSKRKIRIAMGRILTLIGIILGLWLLIFVTDYVMYKNSIPIIFSKTKVNDNHVTMEQGLGYYVIVNQENISEFYLFEHKIK